MYQTDLTIPASTLETSPVQDTVRLNAGTLTRILVRFPPGCANLARTTIHHLGVQIEPWNPDGYIGWDGYVFDIKTEVEIPEGGTDIVVKGWNLDDTYPHTISYDFFVGQKPAETAVSLLQRLLDAFTGG